MDIYYDDSVYMDSTYNSDEEDVSRCIIFENSDITEPLDENNKSHKNNKLSFSEQIKSPIFAALLVFCIFGALVVCINAFFNTDLIDFQQKSGHGLSFSMVYSHQCVIINNYGSYDL